MDSSPRLGVPGDGQSATESAGAFTCPLPVTSPVPRTLTSDFCKVLERDGCPLAIPVRDRSRFETFLANLSATFVNVPATEVDSQIELGLKQIVEFLDLDRSGLGQLSAEGLVITHSYEVPGVPPSPRVILESHFPVYARMIHKGEAFRMPDDLPPEAASEWDFADRTGLKSNFTIPLKMTGAIVGGIGFGSFRARRDWPDELVQRLRLVGDIFTNALARKRAEEALHRADEQARVLRDELAHATRMELFSHVTSSIAHEVNQPLCAIASNAQTAIDLLNMGDVDEAKSALTDIWEDAKRGSEVIARIRGMVKKEEPRRAATSLRALVEDLLPVLVREAARRGIALESDLDAGNQAVVCDRVQLQQVVLNLFLNAVEAITVASVGQPEVRIRAWSGDLDRVRLSVEDTGTGLSPEECEHVFTPFYTTKEKGLGVGLSVSRSIVAAHGGRIWATPGTTCGTVFHIQLPVAPG
jgi:signal transduction histidine kinase